MVALLCGDRTTIWDSVEGDLTVEPGDQGLCVARLHRDGRAVRLRALPSSSIGFGVDSVVVGTSGVYVSGTLEVGGPGGL